MKLLTQVDFLQGVPSSFTSTKSLQDVVTAFIFIGSVGHAAANFCQYDEYAFPPNYPAMLNGERPKDKVWRVNHSRQTYTRREKPDGKIPNFSIESTQFLGDWLERLSLL